MSYIIGVDSGGTFTDTVILDEVGLTAIGKAPSTPDDFSIGIINSVEDAAANLGIDLKTIFKNAITFIQGTTVTLNALLTGRGAKTGLITTKGFEDILFVEEMQKIAGLAEKEIIHAVRLDRPKAIVPRHLIKGLNERIDYKGEIIVPLDTLEIRKVIQELVDDNVEAIAISFLWSFLNNTHEQMAKKLIQELAPQVFVTLSSDLAPRIGEYQRTATAAINCMLSPVSSIFFGQLEKQLDDAGLTCPLFVMQSMGGVMPSEEAGDKAVMTLNSGPVGGVIAAKFLGNVLGFKNIICTDLGGTSLDVGLIVDDELQYTDEPIVAKYHLALPAVDVRSIGTGGGSIARIELGTGILKVGPESSGADPGPVCYDRGGTEPTVTDASVILGYIDPDIFLGGKMQLNKEKAFATVDEKIARPLGLSVVEAAAAIVKISVSHMADLIRKATVERGYDCRNFVLFAYGGAGPQYAPLYGKEIDVKKVLIPALAPVFSAFGLAASDINQLYSQSEPMVLPANPKKINNIFSELEARALDELEKRKVDKKDIMLRRYVSMRYRRQWNEITIPMMDGELTEKEIEAAGGRFKERYIELFGQGAGFEKARIEMITFTIKAVGKRVKPSLSITKQSKSADKSALKYERPAFFEAYNGLIKTKVYDAEKLKPGITIKGHAMIEAPATTVVIQPGQQAEIDEYANIIIHM